MTDTRMYGNQRRKIVVALDSVNPFANPAQVTAAEANAMLDISSVVKWDSTALALQTSATIDDRVLTDAGGAKRRSFVGFGGAINLLTPLSLANTADGATQAFAIFKTMRQTLWVVDRVGPLATQAFAVGDRVNVYKVVIDSKKNLTSGDTSYSYTVNLIPQGTVYPQQVLGSLTPTVIAVAGHTAAMSLTTLKYTWGQAKYGSLDVTTACTWTSSAPAVATVDNHGLVTALSIGTTNIVASYPGATPSTAVAITVAA